MPASLDLLHSEDLFSTEDRQWRDSVKLLVEKHVLPVIESCYQAKKFPQQIIPALAQLGVFGAQNEQFGRQIASPLAYGLISQELEAGDAGVRSFVSVHCSLAMFAIANFGSEEQKLTWLPRMAAGESIGAFALTEAEIGSNPSAMTTHLVAQSKGYRLVGQKKWITNGPVADVFVIWAKLDNEIRGVLLPKSTAGLFIIPLDEKHSFRASLSSRAEFHDCLVPKESLLPLAKGLKAPLTCLNQARYGVAWGALGAARTCLETARDYALKRKQFDDQPIASHQLVQAKLADMTLDYQKALWLSIRMAELKAAGKTTAATIGMLKWNNTETALRIARSAREILGANGITSDYCVMRHMNNLEAEITYEGTSDIHRLTLAREITGISAFSSLKNKDN